jgi:hypothetical protein
MWPNIYHDVVTENVVIRIRLTEELDHNGQHLYLTNPNFVGPSVLAVSPGEEPPVFLKLHNRVADALGIDYPNKPEDDSDPNGLHLADAREVRDRLLSLVERLSERSTQPVLVADPIRRTDI